MQNENPPLANLSPADLVGIAVVTFGFFGLLSGHVKPSGIPFIAAWMVGGFAIQIVAAVINALKGNTLAANLGLMFSSYLMLSSAISFTIKYCAGIYNFPIDPTMEGFLWMPLWIIIWLWTPAFLKMTPFTFNILVFCFDIAIPLLCLSSFGVLGGTAMQVLTWVLLFTGICSLWNAAAMVLAETFQKPVLPMGAPIIK